MAKFCSNCGAKLNEEQAICLECGVLINNTNKTNNNVNSNVNKSDKSSLVGFILGLVSIAAWIGTTRLIDNIVLHCSVCWNKHATHLRPD